MKTFWDYYEKKIQPQVMLADIFFRTEQEPYDLQKAAKQFCLPEDLTKQCDKKSLSKIECMTLLKNSKTILGKLLARQLASGFPEYYTTAQISYIYDLDIALVEQAAKQTGLFHCSERLLPYLFSAIDISQTQYQI